MTAYYLDSSVALRILLGHSESAARWFTDVASDPDGHQLVSSRLLRTEIVRMLRREDMDLDLKDRILRHVGTIPLDHATLVETEAIVPHLKTLDAVHLASAIRSGIEDLVVTTHDGGMQRAARQLGLGIHDPVDDC